MAALIWPLSPLQAQKQQDWIQEAYHKSYFYEGLEKFDAAIKTLAPVLKNFSNGYTVNLRHGWLFYRLGRYGNSKRHYDAAIKAAPASLEAKLGLLLPLLAQERYAEAEGVCYQILRVDFFNYYGNLRLIKSLRKQGKSNLALKVTYKMLDINPSDVYFLAESGLLYVQLKKPDKVASVFRAVLILDPENLRAREHLGLMPSAQ